MSHNDEMPEKPEIKQHDDDFDNGFESGERHMHDKFTKYLAERKTMDDNTPEKKLDKLNVEKLKEFVWECYKSVDGCMPSDQLSEEICSHFGIPERRVPTVGEIAYEIREVTFQSDEVIVQDPAHNVDPNKRYISLRAANKLANNVHTALFAKTEEKK
jgi:hypothetical protein